MLRWYTRCCQTALGNTLADARGCFIGLLRSSLDASRLHSDFGAPIAAFSHSVRRLVQPPDNMVCLKCCGISLNWCYTVVPLAPAKRSDLFNPATTGLVVPRVLSLAERQAVSQPSSIQDPIKRQRKGVVMKALPSLLQYFVVPDAEKNATLELLLTRMSISA